jgi:hypothetical protein
LAIHPVRRGGGNQIARFLSLVVRLALLPAVIGCASKPTLVEQHPLEDPHGPQAVAIVASREAPKTNLLAFARGYAEGTAKAGAVGAGGAAVGALTALQLAPLALLAGPGAFLAFPLAGFIAGGAAVGFVVGTAAAAQAIVPEEQALAIEQMATSAVARLRLPDLTATAVATGVKNLAARDASVIDDEGASRLDGYRSLRERGFGTVIEIRIAEIGFSGSGADTIMALFLTAEAQLVDTARGKPVAARGLVYLSPQHRFGLWAQDGAALTTAEIERAYRTVAERVVDNLVLRSGGGAAPSNAVTEFWFGELPGVFCGIRPLSPKVEWAGGIVTPKHLTSSAVESVVPILAWEDRPAADEGSANALRSAAKMDNIVYDLRIWKVVDEAPGALAYERNGLPRPQHQVEAALDSGSTYFWSVRMRYRVDGRPRATPWGAANPPRFQLGKPLRDALFYSRVEDGTLKRVACHDYDLTPCGCLDFMPAPNLFRFRTP